MGRLWLAGIRFCEALCALPSPLQICSKNYHRMLSGSRKVTTAGPRLAYPQPELLAREVLINLQSQDTFIKGASTRQISDVQGDMVKTRKHARHATARHATRSWAGFAVLADAAELVRLSCWGPWRRF